MRRQTQTREGGHGLKPLGESHDTTTFPLGKKPRRATLFPSGLLPCAAAQILILTSPLYFLAFSCGSPIATQQVSGVGRHELAVPREPRLVGPDEGAGSCVNSAPFVSSSCCAIARTTSTHNHRHRAVHPNTSQCATGHMTTHEPP